MPRPFSPLEVNWPADGLEVPAFVVDVFFDKSSLRGLWREVGRSGEEGGSFFTIILGGTPVRDTFGEPFAAGVDFGLPLPVLCAERFGVAEADVRCAGGEFEDGEGAIST